MSTESLSRPRDARRLAQLLLTNLSCLILIVFSSKLLAQTTTAPLTSSPCFLSGSEQRLLEEKFSNFSAFYLDESPLANVTPEQDLLLSLQFGSVCSGTTLLTPNDLRAPSYRATQTNEKGTTDLSGTTLYTYKGKWVAHPDSHVRLSLFPGNISGFIKTDSLIRFIEPLRNVIPSAPGTAYLSYTNRDLIPNGASFCMADELQHQAESLLPEGLPAYPPREKGAKAPEKGHTHGKGQNPGGNPLIPGQVISNCRFLEIALEEDYEWFMDFGGSIPAANAQAMNILNQVEGLYCADFNMIFQVTLQNIHTVVADPYTSTTLLTRLHEFRSVWNTTPPFSTTPRDVAHMFTGTNFPGGAVGYAYLGVICRPSVTYGVTQNYTSGLYGQLVICAHELGHNFSGMHYDGVSCGSLGSVMCPFVQPNSFYFSPATQANFNSYMDGLNCLAPDIAITPPTATLCSGPSATFSVPFDPDWTYQWYQDSVLIPGATADSYTASIPGTYIVDIGGYDTTCTTCNVSLCAELVSGNMVVTNVNDAGAGSLRQAIINANACPGWDTISFAIPGPGPHTISPLTTLPPATDTVFIDGYSQPGSAEATATTPAIIRIEVSGAALGFSAGITLEEDYSEIAGLCIHNFTGFGSGAGSAIILNSARFVKIHGNYLGTDITGTSAANNQFAGIYVNAGCHDLTIGSPNPADRNLLSSNAQAGLYVEGVGDTVRNLVVQGNYFGTNIDGNVPIPNGDGIYLRYVNNAVIGGTTPGAGNLISGNTRNGINLYQIVNNMTIHGNLIGTDKTGTLMMGNGGPPGAWPFYAGINVNGAFITIGGGTSAERNIISNNPIGINMQYNDPRQGSLPPVENVFIYGNYIGTDSGGINPMGNQGPGIQVVYYGGGATTFTNEIGGITPGFENVIAYNGHLTTSTQPFHLAGISFNAQGFFPTSFARGNTKVYRNKIENNAGKGIYIEPGALSLPEEWKAPILSSVVRDCPSHTPTINGDLMANSPNRNYRIEFFYNFAPDAGGGEGEFFIGAINVLTDGSGNASFSQAYNAAAIPSGSCVSATATSLPVGNTSEFSNNMCITLDPLPITPQSDIIVCEGTPAFTAAFAPFDSVLWTVPSLGYVNTDTLFYTPTVSETVFLRITDTCGRVGFDTLNVVVNAAPNPDLGQDTVLCAGDTLLLDAGSGGFNYEWQDFTFNSTYQVTTGGLFWVWVQDGNFCTAMDSINISIIGPTVDLGTDTTFCPDGILNAGYQEGSTYLWNTGETDQFLLVDSAGQYQVTITDSNGCVIRDTINITQDTVLVDIGPDTVFVSGDSLDAGHPGCTYLWNTGETTRIIYPPAPGNYSVQVICPGGCGNSDDINLTPNALPFEELHLEATLNERKAVDLEWQCEAMDCNGTYHLERADATFNFRELTSGPTAEPGKQTLIDESPLIGQSWYRIRIDRPDGSSLHSNLAHILLEPIGEVKVYPVPATDAWTLEWYFEQGNGMRAYLTDALGRRIWQSQTNENAGQFTVAASDWAAGVYLLQLHGGGKRWVRKVVLR